MSQKRLAKSIASSALFNRSTNRLPHVNLDHEKISSFVEIGIHLVCKAGDLPRAEQLVENLISFLAFLQFPLLILSRERSEICGVFECMA
jgi:hypothetical protein